MTNVENFPYKFYKPQQDLIEKYPEMQNNLFVGEKRYCVTKYFQDVAPILYNFKIRPNDVWLFGYPRSGTTVAQEMAWLLGNDLNYEKASQSVLDVRFPVFESSLLFTKNYENIVKQADKFSSDIVELAKTLSFPAWDLLEKIGENERRFIKTHLPISLAPKDILSSGCKVLYIARNPKDMIVSMYCILSSFYSENIGVEVDFKDFWLKFRDGYVQCTPYFEHLKEGWELRNHKNVLFLFYEEYNVNKRNTLIQIANFLGKKVTEQQLEELENHLKFDHFQKNKSVNNDHLRKMAIMKDADDTFIRKGKVGGWRDYFTEELRIEVDKWIEQNIKGTGLKFEN